MAAMYRTKVSLDGGEPIRANVYILSQAANYQKGGSLREAVVSVTFPPRQGQLIAGAETVTHDGLEYTVRGYPVAIRSLGRIDHWEVTAERVTG